MGLVGSSLAPPVAYPVEEEAPPVENEENSDDVDLEGYSINVSPAVLVGLERAEREDRLRERLSEPAMSVDLSEPPQSKGAARKREIALRKTYVAKLSQLHVNYETKLQAVHDEKIGSIVDNARMSENEMEEKVQAMVDDIHAREYVPPRREAECKKEREAVEACYRDNSGNFIACADMVKMFATCSDNVLKDYLNKFASSS